MKHIIVTKFSLLNAKLSEVPTPILNRYLRMSLWAKIQEDHNFMTLAKNF